MPNALDQVQDIDDSNRESNQELQEEVGQALSQPSSAGNADLVKFFSSSDTSSASLPNVETSSDSSSSTAKPSDSKSSDAKSSDSEKHADDTVSKHTNHLAESFKKELTERIKDEDKRKAFEQAVIERKAKALELEAEMRLSTTGDPVEMAKERLLSVASGDLPDDIEDRIDDWADYQRTLRAATEEATENGWEDDEGSPLIFPSSDDDSELADALNAFADAYEKNERGELTGTAAEGFGGSSGGQSWVDDWNSSLALILDPMGEDDQAQIGSCTMNSEGLFLNRKRPGDMAIAYCNALTTGEHETASGEIVSVFADELGRNGQNNGQSAGIFLMCSLLSSAAYGDQPQEGGLHHRTGNGLEEMDFAGQVLTGYSISDSDSGAYHKLSPGHSMVALNEIDSDGEATKYQYNHWNQMGENEPGEGVDYRYKHQFSLKYRKNSA